MMMEEQEGEQQSASVEPPKFDLASSFCVAVEDDLFIKQEPADPMPDEMLYDYPAHFLEPQLEDLQNNRVYEEIDAAVMSRAVSPPCITDDNEVKIQELTLYYTEKYGLKNAVVRLENCDKIWQTLKMIKDLQDPSEMTDEYMDSEDEDDNSYEPTDPEVLDIQPVMNKIITYKRKKYDNRNPNIPDFRYTVKCKRKFYHCLTCKLDFTNSQVLRDHATEVHGIYVVPKRMYQMVNRIDPSFNEITEEQNMEIEMNDEVINNESAESENLDKNESVTPSIVQAKQLISEVEPASVPEHENPIQSSPISEKPKIINPVIRPRYARKPIGEKMKCVLCKRITTNIVNHMKDYHKVGCINPIIAQCEKVEENTAVIENEVAEEPPNAEVNVSLSERVKKRKRNVPRWTFHKKKRPEMQTRLIPSQVTTAERFTPKLSMAPTFKSLFRNMTFSRASNGGVTKPGGPFKCTVCFGFYKTRKTYNYHKLLHKRRGETAENFNPAKCRFLNSPLCGSKNYQQIPQMTSNYVKPNAVYKQTTLNNFVTLKADSEVNKPAETELNAEMKKTTQMQPILCECGKSFRYNRTLHLHKESCKPQKKDTSDADSGIGISIKIKKNKNDKYEVVQNATPKQSPVSHTIESCRESRVSKDSDALSNDSGVVSAEDNQKVKTHSIMRIQATEDDEEVDIEVGDDDTESKDSNSTAKKVKKTLDNSFKDKDLENKSSKSTSKSNSKKDNAVPSLSTLCKQALVKSREAMQNSTTDSDEPSAEVKQRVGSKCPCGKQFKNLKYFNIHVKRFHPLLLKCNYCGMDFDKIEGYVLHRCEVTEGKLFIEPIIQTQCLKCEQLVDMGEPFDKHMKSHSTDSTTIYYCFKCEMTFENIHQRKLHFNKQHGFALCRVCNKLLHIDYICKHEAYHDGLGHPCHKCKKTFPQKISLKKHIQNSHDPLVNEIVNCIVCSKSITLRYLKKHMSYHLHSEICINCNKCYNTYDHNEHFGDNELSDISKPKCNNCDPSLISDKALPENKVEVSCKSDNNESTESVNKIASNEKSAATQDVPN